MVPVQWDRRQMAGEYRRTRTVARGDWLGVLGPLALYNGQNDAVC